MTDIEISKAVALAIGWKEDNVHVVRGVVFVDVWSGPVVHNYRNFDYRDWNVAGPIAERYDAFPVVAACHADLWVSAFRGDCDSHTEADTPQKAIALAVIQGAKK